MHVLIVKVSSLGDVIHTLPAVTDAWHARRELRFDWVVEEAFAEIPAWHPAVDKVIPVAFRRWRKELYQCWRSGEFRAFRDNLQERHYDLVIDAQGLIKSGIISRLARGLTAGLSNRTIREPLATLFYNMVYTVPWQQHAVDRVRELFSRSFNYSYDPQECNYGLDVERFRAMRQPGAPYVVFFHGTTWESKLWPETYWLRLARLAGRAGYRVRLPWGNAEEKARAERLAKAGEHVEVLDALSLTQLAAVLSNADGAVAVDTGLGHLAAALSIPAVSLYGSSSQERTGTWGRHQQHLTSALSCSPCLKKSCQYQGQPVLDELDGKPVLPPCYGSHPPERVWAALEQQMQPGRAQAENLLRKSQLP